MLLRTKKEMQSLINASRKSLKSAEEQIERLSEKNRVLENNNIAILKRNRLMADILKEIILLTDKNTYNNADLRIRKIKELAETAIKD